jgi:hypothetical protein
MAPGRQADALAFVKKIAHLFEDVTGIKMPIRVVTTGTLGVMCISTDHESMEAYEAAFAKFWANPEAKALGDQYGQELRDGTSPWVPGAEHEEFWRYA